MIIKRQQKRLEKRLGIDEVHSELLPLDKVRKVEKLLKA